MRNQIRFQIFAIWFVIAVSGAYLTNSVGRVIVRKTTAGSELGKSCESVQSTCWRPVTHAQTWASYSAVYWFSSLSANWNWNMVTYGYIVLPYCNGSISDSTGTISGTVSAWNNVGSYQCRNIFCSGAGTCDSPWESENSGWA